MPVLNVINDAVLLDIGGLTPAGSIHACAGEPV